jgi:hypothetical protein
MQISVSGLRAAMRPRGFATRLSRPGWAAPFALLFLTLLAIYAYTPPRWQDWNQNSRFNLTRAIVEDGTVRIDRYVGNTGDYATIDGHTYSDKAPGLSLLAVPVYAATEVAQPFGLGWLSHRLSQSDSFTATLTAGGEGSSPERINEAVALTIATLVCVSVPAASMAVLLALMVERLFGCRTAGILSGLVIGLATPVFTYSQAFYGHIPAAACLVGALALLVLRDDTPLPAQRLWAVGALLGTAVVIEYPAAAVGVPVALLAVWLGRGRAVGWGIAGALPPLAILALYDLIAFGTPLPVGYEHSTLWQDQHQTGFMSLSSPTWDAFWGLTGSSYRGLFYFAPVLLFAIPGSWIALRRSAQRGTTLVALVGFGAMLLFASSSIMWWGGFSVGPRYLLPAVPLLALPLGAFIAWVNGLELRRRAVGMLSLGAVTGLSAVLTGATTFAGQSYPTDAIHRPIPDYVVPAIRDNDIARNLGMMLNLDGLASLGPLVVLAVCGLVAIAVQLMHPAERAT